MGSNTEFVLKDKVALVTGGSRGVGLIFVKTLLEHEAYVSFIDVLEEAGKESEERLKSIYGNDRVLFTVADVTNEEQMRDAYDKTIERFGGLDIVINNAGIADEINFEKLIDVNLTAVIRSTFMAVERMRKDKGGRGGIIISMSSETALVPYRFFLSYTATKCGLIGFTKSLALHLEDETRFGVRVCTMCPTVINTGIATSVTPDVQIPLTRPADITMPDPQENFAKNVAIVMGLTFVQAARMSEALLTLLREPEGNGAVLEVYQDRMAFIYPEQLANKKA